MANNQNKNLLTFSKFLPHIRIILPRFLLYILKGYGWIKRFHTIWYKLETNWRNVVYKEVKRCIYKEEKGKKLSKYVLWLLATNF